MNLLSNTKFLIELTIRNIKAYFKKIEICAPEPLLKDSIQWLGHATIIINLGNKIIVTDPVLSYNLGYFKRLVNLPVDLKKIHIDYILLSHGHMDHLHLSSLLKLNKDAIVIVPNGYKRLLRLIGFKNVVSLNHDGEFTNNGLKIKAIKANHDGRRYYLGNDDSSNSYLICYKNKKIFYAGDTAFTESFKDIECHLALMPVGCYKPDRFSVMHCTPEESFKMFKMMKAKTMVPIHYKTFILSLEDFDETLSRLNNLNDGSMNIANIGQTIKF